MSIQQRGDKWQLRVPHRHLPKPFFSTFDDEASAIKYRDHLRSLLDKGIVPTELLVQKRVNKSPLVSNIIGAYLERASPAPSDLPRLAFLMAEHAGTRVADMSFKWAEAWVSRLKADKRKPGTIRKGVESLARVIDWHLRDVSVPGVMLPGNTLRLLPRGYSVYSDGSVVDVVRDFRLSAEQLVTIEAVLNGVKRADRERPWPADDEFRMFFGLLLDTGLRLREAYKLRVDQLDVARGVLNVEGSKGHRGALKPRVVPLKPALRKNLIEWCSGRSGRMFSFWDGTPEDLPRCSSRLAARFRTLLGYAGIHELSEHDMRHEAACRWVMLKSKSGLWVFNETEICKIMGWSDTRMMLRYASLRGEDLSARLDD